MTGAEHIREKPIPEKKMKAVALLTKHLKESKTILFASLRGLPSSQFQEMKKQLRGEVMFIVPKKNILKRALDQTKKGSLLPLKEYAQDNMAVLFSDVEAFTLSGTLNDKKLPSRAKAGQESPEDLFVEAGSTDIPPGPAMTDFSTLGIKIAIEGGKISIKERKKLVGKGEKISTAVADMLGKLDIKPMVLGLEPMVAYDMKEEKIFTNIKVDKKATIEALQNSFSKALAFAVALAYPTKETISFILQKAAMQEKAIDALAPNQQEMKTEENS